MLIQCTKALLKIMKLSQVDLASADGHDQFPDSLAAWHANIVTIDRRKAIVLMNNETRYPVILYGLTAKDFAKIKELIKEAISVAFRMDGVSKSVIERYLLKAGDVSFSETSNRSLVSRLNKAVEDTESFSEYLDKSTRIQRTISILLGRSIQKLPNGKWCHPIDTMLEDLAAFCGIEDGSPEHVLDVELYQLKVKIDIEGFEIWRRILVPSTYSFRQLHNIMQTVFDWYNYHLHEFRVKNGATKTKLIVMDDDPETLEWIDYDLYEVNQERFCIIKDIFSDTKEVTYLYDFGDYWEHTITFEKVIKSNEFKAIFLEGKGERPPEDVGGSPGFLDYLRTISDDTDPEAENLRLWAESQKERIRSKEKINNRLQHCLSGYYYAPLF